MVSHSGHAKIMMHYIENNKKKMYIKYLWQCSFNIGMEGVGKNFSKSKELFPKYVIKGKSNKIKSKIHCTCIVAFLYKVSYFIIRE